MKTAPKEPWQTSLFSVQNGEGLPYLPPKAVRFPLQLLAAGCLIFGGPFLKVAGGFLLAWTVVKFGRRFRHMQRCLEAIRQKAQAKSAYPVFYPSVAQLTVGADHPDNFYRWYQGRLEGQRMVYASRLKAHQIHRRQKTSEILQQRSFLQAALRFMEKELPYAYTGALPDGLEEQIGIVLNEQCDLPARREALARARRMLKRSLATPVISPASLIQAPAGPTEEERLLTKIQSARPHLVAGNAITIDRLLEVYQAHVDRGEKRIKIRLRPLREASDLLETPETRKQLQRCVGGK